MHAGLEHMQSHTTHHLDCFGGSYGGITCKVVSLLSNLIEPYDIQLVVIKASKTHLPRYWRKYSFMQQLFSFHLTVQKKACIYQASPKLSPEQSKWVDSTADDKKYALNFWGEVLC